MIVSQPSFLRRMGTRNHVVEVVLHNLLETIGGHGPTSAIPNSNSLASSSASSKQRGSPRESLPAGPEHPLSRNRRQ